MDEQTGFTQRRKVRKGRKAKKGLHIVFLHAFATLRELYRQRYKMYLKLE
jgi:hypothetical protein